MGTNSSTLKDGSTGSSGGTTATHHNNIPQQSAGNNTNNNNQNDTPAVHDNNNTPQQLTLVPSSHVDASTANSTQNTQSTASTTTTSTTKTKTNDGANKSQNLTPSVDIINTPPDKSAKGVTEFDDGILSTTSDDASPTSSHVSTTLDSTKKDLDSKFSTADNNTTTTTTELEGKLGVVINAYYVDGKSGISVDYLKDLLFCYRKVEGQNVRLVKLANYILVYGTD